MQRNLKLWREAATLILVIKNFTNSNKWNYKLLTIKRSKTMKFMPNLYTFPGGVIEKSDSSHEWFDLYNSFGLTNTYLNKLPQGRTPIFKQDGDKDIPRNVSLRISAIRETFEECGILLCKSAESKYKGGEDSLCATCLGGKDIVKWQREVQKDPKQFLNMCYQLKIYPDINSLYEWSNWLTPFVMPQQFDTIFFVAAIENIPPIAFDTNEVAAVEICNPHEYLNKYYNGEISLAPPQFYEISKLYNFHNVGQLLNYAEKHSKKGCDQIVPYRVNAVGQTVTFLPGDDMYPNKNILHQKDLITLETLPHCKTMHRVVQSDEYQRIVIVNYNPPYVLPHVFIKNKI